MKNFFLTGATALVLGGYLAGCTHDDYGYSSIVEGKKQAYQEVFVDAYGRIDPNQNWGFANLDSNVEASETMTRGVARSQSVPAVPTMNAPYDGTWVTNYLKTAKEPTAANVADNYDNSTYSRKEGTYVDPYYTWYTEFEAAYPSANYGYDFQKQVAAAKAAGWEHFNDLFTYNADETFVLDFKITGTWNGGIGVAATEGLTDGTPNGFERTVVVTGTWNITEDQRIGSLGRIIIADGGTVNVASGKMLNMVNQAQLVVLRGGKLTGAGSVEVNNGNAAGRENYNGGTVDVAVFNNNFGKFFNYGKFLVTEYRGGAKESNFYNHSLVSIKHTGLGSETPNARIFNACQWYCEGDMRCRNYEGVNGSAFIVGGQLMVSGSEDGTTTPSYFGLAAGALVKVGSLYNNGTSWTGPTTGGYAALEIVDQIDFLNWQQDAPETGGYFENNIYVRAGKWDNIPLGNGYQAGETSTADYKFWKIVANCRGNKGVTKVGNGDKQLLAADADFELGSKGCTPGFTGDATPTNPTPDETTIPVDQGETSEDQITVVTTKEYYETTELIEQGRVFCEDLGQISSNDLDFNDVVFDAYVYRITPSTRTIVTEDGVEVTNTTEEGTPTYKTEIVLLAAGGTLQLSLAGMEVHNKLGGHPYTVIINTIGTGDNAYGNTPATNDPVVLGTDFTYPSIVSIPIRVLYGNGETLELAADQGWAPHKILVPIGTKWCKERVNIASAYTNFKDYVGSSKKFWEGEKNESLLYSHPKDTYTERSTTPVTVLVNTEGPTTSYRNKGTSTTTGGYQGEEVLSRQLR